MPYNFSPSTLKLLKECHKCFWLQFNKGVSRPNGIFPSLPAGMDAVLKAHFDICMAKKELPYELLQLKGQAELFADKDLLDAWQNYRRGIRWEDRAGNVIMGAVDYILISKNRKLIVLDFKTRGTARKDDTASYSQDQLDVYNFLLRKNGFETEDYAYLLFFHPKAVGRDDKNGHIEFVSELVKMETSTQNAEQLIVNALTLLAGPEPDSAEECDFCRYVQASCDYFGYNK